jgi:hypothetical protein
MGNPQRVLQISPFERQDVDKDNSRTPKENIKRSGIFENEAAIQSLFTQIERKICRVLPLTGRPLPWKGREENPFVLK